MLNPSYALLVSYAQGQQYRTLLRDATYAPFGPVTRWTYGNGRVMHRTLNQNYQPGIVQDAAPGGLSLGYEFDEVGNLKTLRNGNQTDPPLRRYGYDRLNRLTETRLGASNVAWDTYTYDATGNRQSSKRIDTVTPYTYATNSHRLQSVGTVGREYDANGNTVLIGVPAPKTGGEEEQPPPGDPGPGDPLPGGGETQSAGAAAQAVRSFAYDAANRMAEVRHDGTLAASYRYNGKGERVRKTAPDDDIVTVYDEAGRWLGDYQSNGQPLQQAIWLDDLPVGLVVGAGSQQKLYYIQADALGTPRVIIDPDRDVVVWRWELQGEAFGDDAPNQDPDSDGIAFVFDLRFPGQRYDSATGMNYNYFRDYESGTGRYLQSDPIGLRGGVGTYGYVSGNSLTRVDPNGLQVAVPLPPVAPVPGLPTTPYTYGPGNPRYDRDIQWLGNQLESFLIQSVGRDVWSKSFLDLVHWMSSDDEAKPNREQKPDGCPVGTSPIDKDRRLDRDKIHKIKDGIRASPKDWVGIDLDGDIWTNEDGEPMNNGNYTDFLP